MAEALLPVAAPTAPHLSVDGFEGPLDFLLEMIRRQRVDLGGPPPAPSSASSPCSVGIS